VGKKPSPRKPSLEEAVALLRNRYKSRLIPPLEGLAYRFTIWLPILSRGEPVFSPRQRFLLKRFFLDCFGGVSESTVEGFPPWSGSWLPAEGEEPIVDHHVMFIVYTLQDAEATTCMRQLKWVLQQDQIAGQEVVLVEQVPVQLVEAFEMS